YVPARMLPIQPLVALPLLLGVALTGALLLRSRTVQSRWSPPWRRLRRFATTGGICYSVNLAVLYTGTELLHLHYAFSLLLSLLVVNVLGLVLNRRWTFESTRNPFWAEALRYWSANALSALGVLSATAALVEVLHVQYLLANVLIALFFLIGNFLLHQRWTFRSRLPLSAVNRRHPQ
ncbi:MAG TPA: GtrA family protein, partial [Polyangiaceae bacterium]|nr:GtrA family protein [Polyangiaceae bacterium]